MLWHSSPRHTWFNIVGFWDPYAHTSRIRVAVANEDEGATEGRTGHRQRWRSAVESAAAEMTSGARERGRARSEVEHGSRSSSGLVLL